MFSHSEAGQPLALLHEVDIAVVGICSLAFGGAHYTKLAVGSMEASTHIVQLAHSANGLHNPPEVRALYQSHVASDSGLLTLGTACTTSRSYTPCGH